MSRPSRLLDALNPLMRMTSIEVMLGQNVDADQRREDLRRTPSDQPRRQALHIR